MAEIKTCEQYVLAKLIETEDALITGAEALKNTIERANKAEARVKELEDFFIRNCEYHSSNGGDLYISINGQWERYEPSDYALIKSIIGEPVIPPTEEEGE